MKPWREASLQWRLTLSLLVATGLVWVVVLALTWQETQHELTELLDAHLAQTASILVAQAGDGHDDDFTVAPVLHKYQPRVAFQVWHEGLLMSRSSMAPEQPMAPLGKDGVSDQQLQGKSWRVFHAQGHKNDIQVLVAEVQSARNDILNAGLRSAMAPLLMALPMLALLVWWAVFQALKPLRQVSQSVSQRQPQALQPLTSTDIPSEVRPLVDALNRLFEKVAAQIESERRFTADAAHELRTPIAAIRMHAQVTQGAESPVDRANALASVLSGCDRASHLIGQLLELARLDAEFSADPSHPACDAVAETRDIMAVLGPEALARGQSLSLQAPDRLMLAMPVGLIGVLVRNLVDNALRYSPDGAQVRVLWQGGLQPRLDVEDGGPGLSAADLARLGDRFFRGVGRAAQGSGLGWSIVRRLAQRHHLVVDVGRSPELGGLRVSLQWPVS